MCNPNQDRFRESYEAFVERGDLDVFREMLDPEVEWRAWNDEGNCHTRDEVMGTIRDALDVGVPVRMPEFIGTGNRFVMIPDLDELPSFFPSGAEGLFQVIEMRNGKVIRMRDFIRRDQALEEAGL
jgi:ketosteroid isomerase-like protein